MNSPSLPTTASVFPGVDLGGTDYYREADQRAEISEELIRKHQRQDELEPGGFSSAITAALEECLALGKLDGLTIASSDGLVVAETSRLPNSEIMAAIGSVFEYVADRAQHTGIVTGVDEMTLLGSDGELAVVRYFPNLNRRFFLMSYARHRCAHRRVTNLALRKCGALLERRYGPAVA
ncbi:MAG: hypothetical protein KDM91_20975 [Verrucomicrobiae bacterium]|nr:hypothetical protein [Verrucomicrobiae bacterium]